MKKPAWKKHLMGLTFTAAVGCLFYIDPAIATITVVVAIIVVAAN